MQNFTREELREALLRMHTLSNITRATNYLNLSYCKEYSLDSALLLACLTLEYNDGKKSSGDFVTVGNSKFYHFNIESFFNFYPAWDKAKGMNIIENLKSLNLITVSANDKKGNFLYFIN